MIPSGASAAVVALHTICMVGSPQPQASLYLCLCLSRCMQDFSLCMQDWAVSAGCIQLAEVQLIHKWAELI